MQGGQGQLLQYLIPAVIIGLVMYRRISRIGKAQRLNLASLWIIPGIFLLAFGAFLYRFAPHGLQWLWMGIALMVGAFAGWRRGKFMRIHVDPETGTLQQQASWAAIAFIVVLLLVRWGLKYEARSFGFDVMFVTDLAMASALGLLTASRAEMYIRAKRLLMESTPSHA